MEREASGSGVGDGLLPFVLFGFCREAWGWRDAFLLGGSHRGRAQPYRLRPGTLRSRFAAELIALNNSLCIIHGTIEACHPIILRYIIYLNKINI